MLFFLDGRCLNSTFLSGWGAVNSMCVQLKQAHSYKEAVEARYVYIYSLCTSKWSPHARLCVLNLNFFGCVLPESN